MLPTFDLNFPRVWPETGLVATFRAEPADFVVEELVGFEPSGAGEHGCFHIEKTGHNTVWVAKALAERFGVAMADVGYCGLKDRHAITRQWFSVRVPTGGDIDLSGWDVPGVRVLAASRHSRKLRPGEHAGNRFVIRLRQIEGDHDTLSERFLQVSSQGVPNYFGEQRFGRDAGNLIQAHAMAGVHPTVWRQRKHQFALAAIRSWLFNQVLAERVRQGTWNVCVEGEPTGTPSGPLWGRGRLASAAALGELERAVTEEYRQWRDILEHTGVSQQRRPLCLFLDDASHYWEGDDFVMTFCLPPGAFATSVIRELVRTSPALPAE